MTVNVRNLRLYVDTVLPAPDGFILATNYTQVIQNLNTRNFMEISLGYDLGYSSGIHYTTFDVLRWMRKQQKQGNVIPLIVKSHITDNQELATTMDKTIFAWFAPNRPKS